MAENISLKFFMKRAICFLFSLLYFPLSSQEVEFSYDYDKSDIQDAFTLLGIRNFKYQMPAEFKGYYFDLIIKEYYEGKEINSISQAKRFENMRQVLQWKKENPEYILKIQTKKISDSIETFNARMPGIGLRGRELKLKFPWQEYDWETLINEKTKLNSDIETPILTYSTQPINDSRPNVAVYCELSPDKNNYKGWYEKFQMKHYFVLCVKATKN
jgi:hypothetical protein